MKFNQELVNLLGNVVCSSFLDVFCLNKQPNIVFEFSMDDMGLDGSIPGVLPPTTEQRRIKQQLRLVCADNTQHVLTKEQIQAKLSDIIKGNTDVGFSYTVDGLRIIVCKEDMTMKPAPNVPFGTGMG